MNGPRIWCTKFGHLLWSRTDISSLDDFAHVSQEIVRVDLGWVVDIVIVF